MKLLNLQYKYLLTKTNKLIIALLLILGVLLEIIMVNPLELDQIAWMLRIDRFDNYEIYSLFYIKMVSIIFSCYLFGNYFFKNNDNYKEILNTRIGLLRYYLSKIFILSLLIGLFIFINLLIHINIGVLLSNWYYLNYEMILRYLEIYWLAIVYGSISVLIICLTNSVYSILIPITLYIISEIIIDVKIADIMFNIIQLIIPTQMISDSNQTLFFGLSHLIVLVVLYNICGYCFFCKKE